MRNRQSMQREKERGKNLNMVNSEPQRKNMGISSCLNEIHAMLNVAV